MVLRLCGSTTGSCPALLPPGSGFVTPPISFPFSYEGALLVVVALACTDVGSKLTGRINTFQAAFKGGLHRHSCRLRASLPAGPPPLCLVTARPACLPTHLIA